MAMRMRTSNSVYKSVKSLHPSEHKQVYHINKVRVVAGTGVTECTA